MTKLCINCKHFGQSNKRLQGFATLGMFGVSYSPPPTCKHPSLPKDLVSGEVIFVYAHDMRRIDGDCGLEGKLFEPEIIEPPTRIRKWWYFWR